MNPIATIAHRTRRTHAAQPATGHRLGLALLTATLLGATACGTASPSGADSRSVTTAPTATPASTITSVASPTTTVAPIVRPTATIDQLVGTQGARVHIRCVGQGDTTVLLMSGFGGDTTSWAHIEPAIATRARVCSYDRPGTGTSDPATSIATFTTQANELHALLNTIDEPGPYVAVGHSFGGAEAITFASLFADEVTGLVLVDASPTTWPTDLCAVPDDGSDAAATVLANCSGVFLPAGNSEHLDVAAAFAGVAGVVTLGSTPVTVITAAQRELPRPGGGRSGTTHRVLEPGSTGLAGALWSRSPGVGRRHRPPHPDRPARRRHRRDHPPAPVTRDRTTKPTNQRTPTHPRSHHARSSQHPVVRRRSRQPPQPVAHPGRARPRVARHLHRPHHHQRRHAPLGRRPRGELRATPVDRRLLHHRVRRIAPHRRKPRRPLRAPTRTARRADRVPRRFRRRRHRRFDDRAHRRPLRHGRRRCTDHANHAVDPRQRVRRPSRTRQGNRRLDSRERCRNRPGTHRRRCADAQLLVVVGVLDQRAAAHRRLHRSDPPRTRLT